MVDSRNGYTPPADYRAPDFVRQWSDAATRGADRIEQEREQRTRDGERDAAQRAQDGQRALEQSASDAQRAAGQAARDADRSAQQLALDAERSATSTAARATYDFDRSGEGAQRGLAYSHGSSNSALQRGPAASPVPVPVSAPQQGSTAPATPRSHAQASPAHLAVPTTSRKPRPASKGPAAKNAAHLGQPGLGVGFAVGAAVAAVFAAFIGWWIAVLLAIAASAGPIKRGFRSGAKGIAGALLAIVLLAAAAGIQVLQFVPGVFESGEAESSTAPTPFGLEGDAVETGPAPEFGLTSGVPLSGSGEANISLDLPAGPGQLAVLDVYDGEGDLTLIVAGPEGTQQLEFGTGTPGETFQLLLNTEGADAQSRGADPTSVATNSVQVLSGTDWEITLATIDVLPSFDASLDAEGTGLYLYLGAGGEATITTGDYGALQIFTHGGQLDVIEAELPASEVRTWPAGPIVLEVTEARRLDGTPLPWSVQVAAL